MFMYFGYDSALNLNKSQEITYTLKKKPISLFKHCGFRNVLSWV